MSGLVGLYRRGAPAGRPEVESMIAALAHRGGDGSGVWVEGAVGLAHELRREDVCDLAENAAPAQPFVSREPEVVVVADARIDNRDELGEALGCDASRMAVGELVARAWLQWGTECAARLIGDFAIVLWDVRERVLYCMRDALGVKPLYYHESQQLFACASEIKSLVRLEGVPREVDEQRVGDFLELIASDEERTFFDGILRLPPGHYLTVDDAGIRRVRYHAFDSRRTLPRRANGEYVDEFRALLDEAVGCRLIGAPQVGCFLSGGLDTSSLVGLARERYAGETLHAFSAVFELVPECDESEFIQAAVDRGGIELHRLHADRVSPLGNWERVLWHQDEACYGANYYLNWGLYGLAQGSGQRAILDGWGGDSVVGYGFERMLELALRARIPTLLRELRATGDRLELPFRKTLRWLVTRRLRRAAGALRPARESTSPTTDPDFARRTGLTERARLAHAEASRPALSCREAWHREFRSGRLSAGLEVLDRAAQPYSICPRYPFFDQRLMEFCAALPADERLRDGWTRSIQRRALSDVLPDRIRTRPWKTDLAASFVRGLLHFESDLIDEVVLTDHYPLDGYVDRAALYGVRERLIESRRPSDAVEMTKVLGLALWLRGFHRRTLAAPSASFR